MLSADGFQAKFTRRNGFKLAFSALWARRLGANESAVPATQIPDLIRNIPPRSRNAISGSQFAEFVSNMDRREREHAILGQLREGNLPDFSRKLVPVQLRSNIAAATIFVMPEYLSIGSDRDFLRIPMNFHTAVAIADHFHFVLPTKKIVDAIYNQSVGQFTPQPLPAGPQMTSTRYYRMHNAMIDTQSEARDFRRNALVAGHKKDVVLTNRLLRNPGRIAIYGWHRAPGMPIQPLSTLHGAGYVDYSHGIRLVAPMALMEGRMRSVQEILKDSELAAALSDEGVIHVASIFSSAIFSNA